mgnify:CR=1 FL=1
MAAAEEALRISREALEAAKAEKRRDARRLPLELGGGRYTKWRNRVVDTERHVLKELGFGFYQMMEHPHKFLLYYIKYLASKGLHLSGVEESSSSSSSSPSASSASSPSLRRFGRLKPSHDFPRTALTFSSRYALNSPTVMPRESCTTSTSSFSPVIPIKSSTRVVIVSTVVIFVRCYDSTSLLFGI